MTHPSWGYCKDCLYYKDPDEGTGLCTRYAPRPKMLAELKGGQNADNATVWPVVSDEDGCGEFQQTEEEKGDVNQD